MQELRLVAVSEDGTYLVLATAGRGTRFTLPVDDRLRAAVRGHFSRLGQFEIEVESPLRPKEIQARIRSGETAEEIAESAGIPVERVRWFEGPVLQEREYMAQQAQRVAVRRPGESTPGPPLGETVEERLGRGGVDLEEVEWDSWKCEDSTWRVRLSFFDNGRPHAAEWVFDPRRRHVSPLDEVAARLTAVEWDDEALSDTVTPLVPRRPAMKVVSNDPSRGVAGEAEDEREPLRAAEAGEYIIRQGRMVDPHPAFPPREEPRELQPPGPRRVEQPREPARPAASREDADSAGEQAGERYTYESAPSHESAPPRRPAQPSETASYSYEPASYDDDSYESAPPRQRPEPPAAPAREESRGERPEDRDVAPARERAADAPREQRPVPRPAAPPEPVAETVAHEDDEPRATVQASEPEPVSEDVPARGDAEPQAAARPEAPVAEARETTASDVGFADDDAADPVARSRREDEPRAAQDEPRPAQAASAPAEAQADEDGAPSEDTAGVDDAEREDETEEAASAEADVSSAQEEAEEPVAVRDEEPRAEDTAGENESADAEPEEDAETRPGEAAASQRVAAPREESAPVREEEPAPRPPAARKPAPPKEPPRPPAKKKPTGRPAMPAAAQADKPSPPAGDAPAPQRPARNRRKSKGKRASVPSWDEIMFGARRPE
ncbi:septation protein SepH [Actinomadura yumaensis]|uniref:Septation protein SepH n=1 Tax=Actinomadura yumaensis TaxID=111807 RepID=A0ABW2CS54_9ACTN